MQATPSRLEVIDHGPEMAEMPPPFGSDRTSGGVGPGLLVVRGFLDAMGGRLERATTSGAA